MERRRCSGGGSSSSASSSLGSCSGSSWLARRWLSRHCPDSIRSVVDALQAEKVCNPYTSLTHIGLDAHALICMERSRYNYAAASEPTASHTFEIQS